MITASGLAEALPAVFVDLQNGADRAVVGLELVEPGDEVLIEPGDLVLVLGARSEEEVLDLVDRSVSASGLVLRTHLAGSPRVRERCREAGLPLLVVPDDAPWSWVVNLLRTAVDRPAVLVQQRAVDVYGDLFVMADQMSGILGGAPVTIEDSSSRVLAYSTGQHGADEARTSTIVGRQVPREVRTHFRALGVFRRLATSDDPFVVPAVPGVKPRYVVPVRASGEWLGSVWAVVDDDAPLSASAELSAAVQVIGLYLLRLRAQSELHRQVQVDHVRSLLQPGAGPVGGIGPGQWRVAVLSGPEGMTSEARCELWQTIVRRHGWREPLVADLDDSVYVVVTDTGNGPGGWTWLGGLVMREALDHPGVSVAAGGAVDESGLVASRAQADEVARLTREPGSVASIETAWPAVVLARAVQGVAAVPPVSPVSGLGPEHAVLTETLVAVIDHWGEPQRAAAVLGVHPNTVRHRMLRLRQVCDLDVDDPRQRLAARLELEAQR